MDQRDAFLRAIRDDPEDDTTRLVFADWLDERGDAVRARNLRDGVKGRAAAGLFRRVGGGTFREFLSCIDTAEALSIAGAFSWRNLFG